MRASRSGFRVRLVVCAAAALLAGAAPAAAALVVGLDPGTNSVTVAHEGNVRFVNADVAFDGTYDATIIALDQTSLTVDKSATYDSGDLDWSDGFRWTEVITNNTGSDWTSYSIELTTEGSFFSDAVFSPGFVTVDLAGVPDPTDTRITDGIVGTLSLDPTNTVLTLTFTAPIADGTSFSVHAPIEGLSGTTGFSLVQTAIAAVPEPTAALTFAAGLFVVGAAVRKRQAR